MTPWKKICCAVDFTEHSRATLQAAATTAERLGADLLLVHVFEPPAQADLEPVVPPSELYGDYIREAAKELEAWRVNAERIAIRPVTAKLVDVHEWHPALEIVRFARDQACDAIFVGKHGRSGVRHPGLGAVAERVIHESDRTVVVVRQP